MTAKVDWSAVEKIANAVLYEGYVLYPYRPTSVKNRQRWTFGGLLPESYCRAQGIGERSSLRVECPVEGEADTEIEVRLRFLQLQDRMVEQARPGIIPPEFYPVDVLQVGNRQFRAWQEAVEQDIRLEGLRLGEILAERVSRAFDFPAGQSVETILDADGAVAGRIVRRQAALAGEMNVSAEAGGPGWYRLRIEVHNRTEFDAGGRNRDDALLHGLASAHVLLAVRGGQFVSLLDPPDGVADAPQTCHNDGVWPVLIGQEGKRDLLLASPIILYDYPQIAAESPGDLFDGTEIDEILTLRILTLTDDEKEEARQTDERARALLDRTEALTGEQLMNLHGALRRI